MNYTKIADTYNFECTMCANCCTGDTQILLDFFDLYKMGRFLDFRHSDKLFKQNYVFLTLTENEIWRPQLRFKKKPFSFCPFLMHQIDDKGKIGGLCQLHPDNKPLVCATAPIGVRYDFESDVTEYIFHPPAPDCPGIQSHKQNHITDLDKKYRKELNYQQITFRILENIRPEDNNKEKMQELFSFPLYDDFNTTLSTIMKMANIFI
jgi:Fe-S-cluster containining protein